MTLPAFTVLYGGTTPIVTSRVCDEPVTYEQITGWHLFHCPYASHHGTLSCRVSVVGCKVPSVPGLLLRW
jgi:hypothetical protein